LRLVQRGERGRVPPPPQSDFLVLLDKCEQDLAVAEI
jgi:hypothetical protein